MMLTTKPDAQQSGLSGLGYFDTGLDFTGWGLAEWFTVGALAIILTGGLTFLGDTRSPGRRRKLARLRAKYELDRNSL